MRVRLRRPVGRWSHWLLALWALVVYAAYFGQFDFYLAYALGLLRRVMPLVAVQL